MANYRLTIQYDGGRYKGWQRLGRGENTIQGKLENVISELIGVDTEIIGCSRTDAGVHALCQVANFHTDKQFTEKEIMDYFIRYLPKDISVVKVELVPDKFHARYHAKSKTYLYKIWNRKYPNPFMRKYSMHIEEKLDLEEMKKAAAFFIGKHDFTAYSNAKSKKKSMVRNIISIDIKEEEGFVNIRICGDGFLYNMVRKIVGTLIEVGLGKKKPCDIPHILESKLRKETGIIAEAGGLYLEKVEYQ
ncbi:tRNA pseudouridine(38-40) synthase TruA [Herbinix luporum]|jgi:tRNA pseudouridine38-40 synthase|uniref:tRNA pseudouridine synthase A n=1 Tax=Herbinix luporum TaxID=1679721 RepID=A0A0K8J7M5_9FIRM|nr:tRNA pseudouridine(38-40) synthase TruA [Herbinix luporum]MDI9488836.1 tRNA pseudouridine(38-40) synthase TruA [Bacillota bacterium]CUH93337.1 tRNA pseudouridine synthase A 2 [Herbinix luporum]HHT56228.1 tRNA pseudouridine(38-40) synthase TruA [Herbinix luporum]